MDNPETLFINVRENTHKGAIKNGQSRDTVNKRQRIPKGQSKLDNPEKLATQGTQDTGQINVREYRRGNQNWTIQRNWQPLRSENDNIHIKFV